MDEQVVIQESQELLTRSNINDEVMAVGVFYPRGHTAGAMVGGLAGADVGGAAGDLAGAIGLAGGYLAGKEIADRTSGLPGEMFVAVSNTHVYLMVGKRDPRLKPVRVLGTLDRVSLQVKVHQRVNVKVVELIDESTGAKVELEGSRIPTLHVGDVLSVLTN
jgi:hypothetical protein